MIEEARRVEVPTAGATPALDRNLFPVLFFGFVVELSAISLDVRGVEALYRSLQFVELPTPTDLALRMAKLHVGALGMLGSLGLSGILFVAARWGCFDRSGFWLSLGTLLASIALPAFFYTVLFHLPFRKVTQCYSG